MASSSVSNDFVSGRAGPRHENMLRAGKVRTSEFRGWSVLMFWLADVSTSGHVMLYSSPAISGNYKRRFALTTFASGPPVVLFPFLASLFSIISGSARVSKTRIAFRCSARHIEICAPITNSSRHTTLCTGTCLQWQKVSSGWRMLALYQSRAYH